MATEIPAVNIGTQLAGADLRTKQFTFVTLDNAGKVIASSTLGGKVIGVLQNKPNTGEVADVMAIGQSKVVASAGITAGDNIMSAANGLAATAATTGSSIVGKALETAAGANEVITAFINCGTGVV